MGLFEIVMKLLLRMIISGTVALILMFPLSFLVTAFGDNLDLETSVWYYMIGFGLVFWALGRLKGFRRTSG
jgi:hypothetical protein